ncbi:hypothetical protein ACFXO2_35100, partial [Streptomyces sp. NPDC059152]
MAKYFDVHPENPQRRTVTTVADAVRSGALIAYPTDSCFALGCQLGSRDGVGRQPGGRHPAPPPGSPPPPPGSSSRAATCS